MSVTPILPLKPRRLYRPPLGLPKGREDWRIGTAVSALVHVGFIVLLIAPLALAGDLAEIAQGAGGPGPAGGGGGARRADLRGELLRYVRVVPPSPTPEVKAMPPKAPPPPPDLTRLSEQLPEPGLTAGTNTGAADNSGGGGPGSGGGVGSGIGTGRGSSVGPGTGGGAQANYPPTPTEIFIPPLPVPTSVKGHHLIAEFDIDETGRVLSMTFNETRDRGYNRRLAEVLRAFRFRPGTRPDGTPIRMKTQVVVDLY